MSTTDDVMRDWWTDEEIEEGIRIAQEAREKMKEAVINALAEKIAIEPNTFISSDPEANEAECRPWISLELAREVAAHLLDDQGLIWLKPRLRVRFPLGKVVVTPGIRELLEYGLDLRHYLQKHHACDWGDLGTHDWNANNLALFEGSRIVSAYVLRDGTKIWIITEADRSATTAMLPSEY